jgi:threonine aldolase
MRSKKLSERTIDLRSDTVSPLSLEMRNAIFNAKAGDELYGDYSSTSELEEYCAQLFKKEAAVFVPSGIMANQISIRCHTLPGDSVLCNKQYHLYYYESAATSDLGKVSFCLSNNEEGFIAPKEILDATSISQYHAAASKVTLLWIENTINALGGKIYPLNAFLETCLIAKEQNLSIHLDGARLFNAAVATDTPIYLYAQVVDSIMLSFTKSLGAPLGAILVGSSEVIEKARKFKKWYGGGMHQSCLMAAACLYAIKNNVNRIKTDHDHAKLFSNIISQDKRLFIFPVETNIILINISKLGMSSKEIALKAKELNILVYAWNKSHIRVVTHAGISHSDVVQAASTLLELFSKL